MNKLSGFAKFELDTKINSYQFFRMLESMSIAPEVVVEDVEEKAEEAEAAPK